VDCPAKAVAGGLTRVFSCACVLAGAYPSVDALAQDGAAVGVGQYGPSFVPLDRAAVGQTISRVDIEIVASSGDTAQDEAAVRAARAAVGALEGRAYQPALVDTALGLLLAEGTVRAATHRIAYDGALGTLGIVVSIDLSAEAGPDERVPASERAFPVIYQDDRTKLTFITSTGGGLYADFNPWFGEPELFNEFSPIAGRLPGSQTAWGEGYVEFGMGGATVSPTPTSTSSVQQRPVQHLPGPGCVHR
jgi:hypothetical protein